MKVLWKKFQKCNVIGVYGIHSLEALRKLPNHMIFNALNSIDKGEPLEIQGDGDFRFATANVIANIARQRGFCEISIKFTLDKFNGDKCLRVLSNRMPAFTIHETVIGLDEKPYEQGSFKSED
ncbi:MAG: hypothetical protein ABIE68_01770 [bacterium]